jgi:hypothetical protein
MIPWERGTEGIIILFVIYLPRWHGEGGRESLGETKLSLRERESLVETKYLIFKPDLQAIWVFFCYSFVAHLVFG